MRAVPAHASFHNSATLPSLALGALLKVSVGDRLCTVDHAQLRDISIGPTTKAESAVSAFGVPPVRMSPLVSVATGARCNCYSFDGYAPHLQGTHIESREHVLLDPVPVVERLKGLAFVARLVTVSPVTARGLNLSLVPDANDSVLTRDAVVDSLANDKFQAPVLILRTPHFPGKETFKYGGSNPVYPHHEVAAWLVSRGVEHVVLDLPSADREEGELFFHRTFWQDPIEARSGQVIPELSHVPNRPRIENTITELAFIPPEVPDGWYLIYLCPIGFPGDAAPVRPLIAPILDLV